ncbi:MFS transporter [Azorhizobium oxalatiphilum]|uniref:MFS transporter n=1 Tax=Azorhizobium oxalatiphilum TaxID=980631 RepID=A0A917C483_9HYPH|nr:MFS transporter [Azorhizobium oxalatiphilum]GGF70014.1 MFS transporter [Azorhizobium oxalatiphilum]
MAVLTESRGLPLPRVLLAIGGVYVAQSLVGGLSFMGIPTALRAQGLGLEVLSLVSLLMLPWALKFIWAPYVERYRIRPDGRRRSRRVVIVGELLCVAALALAAVVGPQSLSILLAVMALVALASATVDIAADAFAIEQLSAANRGWGNVAQVGGAYFGILIGGGLFLWLLPYWGWTNSLLVMACGVLLLTIPFAFTQDPAPTIPQAGPAHRPSLGYALRRREVRFGLAITMLFELGVRLVQSVGGPLLVDRGVDLQLIGTLNAGGAVLAGLTGTIAGGLLVKGLGFRNAVVAAMSAQVLVLALYAGAVILVLPNEVLIGCSVALSFAMAMGFVALYAQLMGLSSLKQAGVDFTLFQCADAFMAGLAGFAGGQLAGRLGYGASFGLAAAVALVGLAVIPSLLRRAAACADVKG